ncbi:formylmethanofuran--tetrahydromethanopterin formyltransferase [Prosthecomicrobium hirschii]|uniref:Formylmethanofuran--tetrahydromethanopterin formyltransferase n=1 Tax=Prosthecodimorpha hirschii TaxID=665126 RepID=A0A0N8GES7_9HYPH|nr:formylmethanofuran--tetrahydromethanopterin N-formyltransferase [Prosthecomicrobium hirschii]KPL52353.1 formylmethanofuran--tetrahydromethanopterin formyltransferase [Prosthecomicrobium hirschii]
MQPLSLNGVTIDDSFAEAFDMAATGLVITAPTARWAEIAARTMTGFATSVIACGVEAGIDRELSPDETPDGRPGFRVLMFGFDGKGLEMQIQNRVGQCVLTSPGSACFAGLDGTKKLKLGATLRFFGDGNQISKRLGGTHYWRVPVMDGEFLVEHSTGLSESAIGGGNLLILGRSHAEVLEASEAAVAAASTVADVILPFPGGIVRSGSKVGSKYKALIASTNNAFCPVLRGDPGSELDAETDCVMELVMDGLSFEAIRESMRRGLHAACAFGPEHGILRISAGNYGGNLGRHHFKLRDLI